MTIPQTGISQQHSYVARPRRTRSITHYVSVSFLVRLLYLSSRIYLFILLNLFMSMSVSLANGASCFKTAQHNKWSNSKCNIVWQIKLFDLRVGAQGMRRVTMASVRKEGTCNHLKWVNVQGSFEAIGDGLNKLEGMWGFAICSYLWQNLCFFRLSKTENCSF